MCTVTIVPTTADLGAWRMACSRDEQHSRAPALPPQDVRLNGVDALMPTDPVSNGTWVAVNAFGLALTLLNYNLPNPPTGRILSRGTIIPRLITAQSVGEVLAMAADIEADRMMPFRLVAFDGEAMMLWRSTAPIQDAEPIPWRGGPVMFTSSGLGDHRVEGPRRTLFTGWFGEDPSAYADQQLAFHRHQWPGREHLSVCMHRDDARTVSYTTIDVTPDRIAMTYHPERPDRDAPATALTLTPRQV